MVDNVIYEIDVDDLKDDDYELKFFLWGRKIEEGIDWLEDNHETYLKISEYLQKCADMREKFLDKNDLTETEDYYTDKINSIFRKYGVKDPIY